MPNLFGQNGIVALYVSYYGRAPEPEGYDYWQDRAAAGTSLADIARSFAQAPETKTLYPALADGTVTTAEARDFINQIYQNLFNRDAEPEGLNYWSQQLANGADTSTFILAVLGGATGTDSVTVDNKIAVATAFVNADILSTDYTYNINDAREIIDDVSFTQASVNAALNEIRDEVYPEGETVTVPGGTVYVPTPTPVDVRFANANAELAASGLKADGSQQTGNGNFNTGFTVVETRGGGENDIQSGINAHLRQASNVDSYFKPNEAPNADGTFEINALKGQQLASNGSQSDNAGRQQTAIDLALNVDAFGGSGKSFADYDVRLLVDIDASGAKDYVTFQMDHSDAANNFLLATGGYAGGITDGAIAINGDSVYSDSLNYAFIDTDAATAGVQAIDFNALGEHSIRWEVYDRGTTNLVHEHETVINFVGVGDPAVQYIH